MNLKKGKNFASSLSVVMIFFDILLVIISINSNFIYSNSIIRGIVLFFLLPIIQIFNIKYSNRITNRLLFIYEIFLFIVNLFSFTYLFYEETIEKFGISIIYVFGFLSNINIPDFIFICVLLFVQPLTVSLILFGIISTINKILKKHNKVDGSMSL